MAVDSPSQKPGGAAVLDKAPERVRKRSPRYKVLLHNDPVNSMEYVVATLQQVVPQLSEQDCMAVMLEAHNTGVGLVIVCDVEPKPVKPRCFFECFSSQQIEGAGSNVRGFLWIRDLP